MGPTVQRVLDRLERGGFAPRQNGAGWQARCPTHQDRVASLSIGEGRDGRALLKCHAGCEVAAVVESLGLTLSDIMPPRSGRIRRHQPETTYDYHDESGAVLFRVVRRADKGFLQQRPDGHGGWTNGVRGVRRVPYMLPEMLAAIARGKTVYVVEGEKDALALVALGLSGTTNPGGALKWRDEFAGMLRGAKAVRVLADNDEPGRKHAGQVASSFHAAGVADLRMVQFTELPEHNDVSDWLELPAQATLAPEARKTALLARIEAAPIWQPASAAATSPGNLQPQRQGRGLLLTDPEPWPEPVDRAALLADLVATLNLYIVLPPGAAVTIVLWVVLTYLTDVVEVLPRLLLTSPTRACGKSRLLAVLGALVRRALPASSITPSATFRIIEAAHPTLLLDEMDNARLDENSELRAILNSGHERANAWTVRNVGEDHEPRHFSTWAPVALACIGKLPDTVTSRCIRVPMRRRTRDERVERMRGSRLQAELEPLRRRLHRWAQDHAETIRTADPQVPTSLDDREADNWTSLLAIADAIGGSWPELARKAATALSGMQDDEDVGVLLLGDLRDLFAERKTDRLSSEDVVTALKKLDNRPWADWGHGKGLTARGLARLVKAFAVEPRTVKRKDGTTAKGYLREWFDDPWARYLTPYPSPASPAASIAAETLSSNPSPNQAVTDAKGASDPHEHCMVMLVTDTSPRVGGNELSSPSVEPFDLPREAAPWPGGNGLDYELLVPLDRHGWERAQGIEWPEDDPEVEAQKPPAAVQVGLPLPGAPA